MTTLTLWILMTTGWGYRPPVVIERFATEADCLAVATKINSLQNHGIEGPAYCLRATVAR